MSAYEDAVVVDANVLALLLVGSVGDAAIKGCRRTDKYDVDAYSIACQIVGRFRNAVTTPHILAEVSNLLDGALAPPFRKQLADRVQALIRSSDERFVPGHKLGRNHEIGRLGLSDCAVIDLARRGCTVLTDDRPLVLSLHAQQLRVLYLTALRFPDEYS